MDTESENRVLSLKPPVQQEKHTSDIIINTVSKISSSGKGEGDFGGSAKILI